MFNEIWLFVLAIGQNGWALYSGGVVSVLIAGYKWRKKQEVPWRWLAGLMVILMCLSCFLAWHDLYQQMQIQQGEIQGLKEAKSGVEGERKSLEKENRILQNQVGAKRDEISHLATELARVPSSSKMQVSVTAPKEPAPIIWWRQKPYNLPDNRDGNHYAVEVTIRSDRELVQPELKLKFTAPITDHMCGAGSMYEHTIDGNEITITMLSPKLSPNHHWLFVFYSTKPIRLSKFIWLGGPPVPVITES